MYLFVRMQSIEKKMERFGLIVVLLSKNVLTSLYRATIEMNKMYKTFNEWSKEGYKIIKGSKSTRIKGVCYFNETQVVKLPPKVYDIYGDLTDWDEDYEDPFDDIGSYSDYGG